jgi:hypothetical protein
MDNCEPIGFGNGLAAARYVELLVNVLGVTFYGCRGDKELVRNLPVA